MKYAHLFLLYVGRVALLHCGDEEDCLLFCMYAPRLQRQLIKLAPSCQFCFISSGVDVTLLAFLHYKTLNELK